MKLFIRLKIRFIIAILLMGLSLAAYAQDTTGVKANGLADYYDMSLEQLKSVKASGVSSELEKLINSLIAAASKKPLSSRESPSIVSLVTAEEIANSGARDLIDVLRLVPGFDFGVDVNGVVGMGIRGNWAHEGKVLLLIDGQEMNELLYTNLQFGNHYPIEQIQKIEIIRGPGSAIYGGFAEYGVINIITKSAQDINGVSVTGSYGKMQNTFGHRNINAAIGKKEGDFAISVATLFGQGNRSDQTYSDFSGNSYSMVGNSSLNPRNVNVGISYKDLSFRGISDNYHMTIRDFYDVAKPQPFSQDFDSYFAELKYNHAINDKFTITPVLNYKRQIPWKVQDTALTTDNYYRVAERYKGSLLLSYNVTRKINVIAGGEFYRDMAENKIDTFNNGQKKVSYDNYAFYTQGLIKLRLVNIIAGARYDKHSHYGASFVPRVGFTKKINRVHFKLLYSNSFRAPSIENINLNGNIKPEKTQVLELETGYQFTRKSIFTVNIFDITTKDPIIYFYDPLTGLDNYINYPGKAGSRGFEMEYRIKDTWGYVNVNYSLYVAKDEKAPSYTVPGNDNVVLAFPANKFNLNTSFRLTQNLSFNPSASYMGRRYGWVLTDTLVGPVIKEYKPSLFVNVFFNFTDLYIKGLSFGIGVYDILDEKMLFIQPYNAGHPVLPGLSREWVVKLSYNFHFKETRNKE